MIKEPSIQLYHDTEYFEDFNQFLYDKFSMQKQIFIFLSVCRQSQF